MKNIKYYLNKFFLPLRALLRLFLVHRNKERIIQVPAISPLNHDKLNKVLRNEHIPKEGYQLRRTGLVVRSVHYPGPLETGQWSKLTPLHGEEFRIQSPNPESLKNLSLSEVKFFNFFFLGKKNFFF